MRLSGIVTAAPFLGLGLSVFVFMSQPAVAAASDDTTQAAEQASGSGDESEAMSRREQRRQARQERREQRAAAKADAAIEPIDAAAADSAAFVVAVVEPEMECTRRVVSGSRVPKEVCVPVGQAAADEANAQDFLRRIRERSGEMPAQSGPTIPGMSQ